MGAIFINYRREDSSSTAGRLHDRLTPVFGPKAIFMDVDNIPVGVDFVEHLTSKLAACKVVLVVIGPNWLNAKDETGQRRLDNPDDYVAIEIEAALARNIRVIPVLVDGAAIPKQSELPDSLKRLARRQGFEVRHSHFGRDVDALIVKVRDALSDATRRWTKVASATTVLLLTGSIGLFWFWTPATFETTISQKSQVEARTVEKAERQRIAAGNAEEQRRAEAAADADARRKSQEAEQQRLAAAKADEERKAKAAADAEAQRKSQEAEQQRVAAAKADEERKAKAAIDAEAQRKSQEAEKQRVAAAKADEERKAKAAIDAEAQRKSQEAEQQRVAAAKADEERKAKAAADAEAQRKSREAEQLRQAAAQANEQRKTAQDSQRASPAVPSFQIAQNLAVEGNEYKNIADSTIESCSSACVGDAQCKMFSYWPSKICYLFDSEFGTRSTQAAVRVGFVRVSPRKSVSDSQLGGPAAAVSQIVQNIAVDGNDYRHIADSTIASCSVACVGDARCKMFSYWPSKICYLFDSEFGSRSTQAAVQVGFVRVSPRKSVSDSQLGGPAAAVSQIVQNIAVDGNDYRHIADSTIASCSVACVGDARCKMFSYWPSKICYLFDSEYATRSTQAAVQVGFVRVSPKQVIVQRRSPAAVASIVQNVAVRGDEYSRKRDATIESCSSACVADAQCKMFAYWQGGVCYLFDKNLGTYAHETSQVGRVRQ